MKINNVTPSQADDSLCATQSWGAVEPSRADTAQRQKGHTHDLMHMEKHQRHVLNIVGICGILLMDNVKKCSAILKDTNPNYE